MNKKIVVITLLLTTAFVVGGAIIQTHGETSYSIGNVSEYNYAQGWHLSIYANANESGANAYVSPGLLNIDSIVEATTESGTPVDKSGYASAYVLIYKGKDPKPKTDPGKIYAKLEVTVEKEKTEIENDDGTITTIYTTVKSVTPDSKGRSKYKEAGEYIAKDSGVCGNFGNWHFSAYDRYRFTQ